MSTLTLSIITCTYNRKDFLRRCLDSLTAQKADINSVETIVVDNNSSDATRATVESFRGSIPGLKYIFEEAQGLSVARNRGCHEASGDYLAYLDDDAMAP